MTVIPPTLVSLLCPDFRFFPLLVFIPLCFCRGMNKTPAPSTGPGSSGHEVEIGWMTEWMDDEGVWKARLTSWARLITKHWEPFSDCYNLPTTPVGVTSAALLQKFPASSGMFYRTLEFPSGLKLPLLWEVQLVRKCPL